MEQKVEKKKVEEKEKKSLKIKKGLNEHNMEI